MCDESDTPRFLVLAWPALPSRTLNGLLQGRETHMVESSRSSSVFGTPGGRHRRQLVFSERILRGAPVRAAVTVFAVVIAGLTTPMFQASADTGDSSYLVT